jgi:16S rRNA (cytosine1402-N4)-methyltransferase
MSCEATLQHSPVLCEETIKNLLVRPEGFYIDATFGRGGHAKEILQRLNQHGRLIVIDKDPEAIKAATALTDARVIIRHGSFASLFDWVKELDFVGKIAGILLDLGVSSPQLDEGARGFSFMHDGPLDMRMDTRQKLTAAIWLNSAKEEEIAKVIFQYGEEHFSRRIAKAIVEQRAAEPIATTGRLAEIVKKAHPRWEKGKHPATRVFQAIRIFINNELVDLESCLEQCLEVLCVGGRLLVISFHSLEGKIVTKFMQKHSRCGDFPAWVPVRHDQCMARIKIIERAIRASDEEIFCNPRARSASLRVMEKVI